VADDIVANVRRIVDRFTNYRSRYGYPLRWAVAAEIAWRVEHMPGGSWAYTWRKRFEHAGSNIASQEPRS
jgi:hypothetical protein